jgi:ABC-2 type transport system permease protein
MIAILAALKKEYLMLVRDRSGLILLFLMPAFLVIIMSLLQDNALRKLNDDGIPVLVINEDQDSIGYKFIADLKRSNVFQVVVDSVMPAGDLQRYIRAKGMMAYIHIPKGASENVRKGSSVLMSKIMSSYGMPATDTSIVTRMMVDVEIDPTLSKSQVLALNVGLDRILLQLQGDMMVNALIKPGSGQSNTSAQVLELRQIKNENAIVPNAVQHNVPAWTIFSMFFIIVPLATSMVNERKEGSLFRLKTIQEGIRNVMIAKVMMFLTVGVFQMLMLLLIGLYLIPLFGLPALQTGNQYHLIFITTFSIAFAASSFGLFFGTVAQTHQQASVGGAVTILLFAALGGVWVPVYLMPSIMQKVSLISPLNWGLEAFHDLFLRTADFSEIVGKVATLLIFGAICLFLTIRISNYRNSI